MHLHLNVYFWPFHSSVRDLSPIRILDIHDKPCQNIYHTMPQSVRADVIWMMLRWNHKIRHLFRDIFTFYCLLLHLPTETTCLHIHSCETIIFNTTPPLCMDDLSRFGINLHINEWKWMKYLWWLKVQPVLI